MREEHKASLRQALKLFELHPSVYYYKPLSDSDKDIREQLSSLSIQHNRWGCWMMHHYLRNLNYGCNVINDYNREALNITIDTSLTSKRVIKQLNQLIAWRGQLLKIRIDNGPECVSEALAEWAQLRNVELKFIQKGKPFQNGFMERFNRSYKEEVLDAFCFRRLKEAQVLTNAWIWIYNNQRPHGSLGYKSPIKFLHDHQKNVHFPSLQKDEFYEWNTLIETVII